MKIKKIQKLIEKVGGNFENLNFDSLSKKQLKKFHKSLKKGKKLEQLLEKFLISNNQAKIEPEVQKINNQQNLFDNIETKFKEFSTPEDYKRVFISFLGKNQLSNKKVNYVSSIEDLSVDGNFYDMYHLISESFYSDSKLIFIGTKDAIELHESIGKFYQLPKSSFENIKLLENENNFKAIFQTINEIVSQESLLKKEIIVDLTHGFRHLPLLTLISIITNNLSYQSISKLIFAKIISKDNFEVIDLIEYIDIANINYALENFKVGYSLLEVPQVKNELYQNLLNNIHDFSKIMVGNLFGEILKPNSIAKTVLNSLEAVLNSGDDTFKNSLEIIKTHILSIVAISNEIEKYKQFFELSKIFRERKFYLNSAILLNEAVGHYFGRYIRNLKIPELSQIILQEESSDKFDYELANTSRNVFQQMHEKTFSHYFFNRAKSVTDRIRERIRINIPVKTLENISNFIEKLKSLRNSISHGSLGSSSIEIEIEIEQLFSYFEEMIATNLFINKKEQNKTSVKQEQKVSLKNESFKIIDQELNYEKAIEQLEQLNKEEKEYTYWRLPNITEIKKLYDDGLIKKDRLLSSSEKYKEQQTIYILRRGKVVENSKQNVSHIIFVNKFFDPIKDTILSEETHKIIQYEQKKLTENNLENLKVNRSLTQF